MRSALREDLVLMLRWQPAEGLRHAVDSALPMRPDESFEALCGVHVRTVRSDFAELGGSWFEPTCLDCDDEWRRRQGMSPRYTGGIR